MKKQKGTTAKTAGRFYWTIWKSPTPNSQGFNGIFTGPPGVDGCRVVGIGGRGETMAKFETEIEIDDVPIESQSPLIGSCLRIHIR
jgi:hypothetical protein